ncbi:1-aminocyclopropane-1-carboxylate deaminase/D-cysteine desulfhydrase [Aquimarina sp. RZ0]|uniref:1-aminocyclopropane-1-carboxylate deaminase/D-cysteine desulfhydrase n=1 Tax=Aquimarina sp. RZ0 TaxID=2607730 RepID=UPI0011F3044F|nr:pyridoxal-phosphate dependent enzyme [Aquimarina sp. RZ0]KAA1242122.1 1-aminocyclopropane-1-carboxylate deaminase/D-cysteine desulfhydrase [Aquimarina sp. RZ0]
MQFFSSEGKESRNEEIFHPILKESGVSLCIKREDLIHEYVSGNKFRKLKYNLSEAKRLGYDTLLTFGGAYSNHIAAVASAGRLVGLRTIGVIRGEELLNDLEKTLAENATLMFASACGMRLKFISRGAYREKGSSSFLEGLQKEFGRLYIIPEGGTNDLAIKGCEEILNSQDSQYDVICCAVGTGGTVSGIINSSLIHQSVLGFPALKGSFLTSEIKKYTKKTNWELVEKYHFGGYGKINKELIEFINTFRSNQNILLDPIYTGKMIYGLFDMIQNGVFTKNTRILAIHTGGLQGVDGMNNKLAKKRLPLINI